MILIVFTQNLILDFFEKFNKYLDSNEQVVFLTTQYLFENERDYIRGIFGKCEFRTFADYLTDAEMAKCDTDSYYEGMKYDNYIEGIKKAKNEIVCSKFTKEYDSDTKYIMSNDLGIDISVWVSMGYRYLKGEYYFEEKIGIKNRIKSLVPNDSFIRKCYAHLKKRNQLTFNPKEVYVGYYNKHKYVFVGNMNRIGYRFDTEFSLALDECEKLNRGEFENKNICTYITTWHEHGKCKIPDDEEYDVKWAQDGYLPPNYSHKDYHFKPNNVVFYCWDTLGTALFKNQELPYELIPFRKKLYIPEPVFSKKINRVLIAASGSGDWTALKNRSDDDLLVEAIVEMAKRFPEIKFVYRCHPTWIHPLNVGVNAINRVGEYFNWLKLPNLELSGNIPSMSVNGEFQYSFSRTSLDEDLKDADLVIGEHSIAMIDAAFKQIPFFSANLTKRRNFYEGINELGFPQCSSIDEMEKLIKNMTEEEFKIKYLNAIENYNKMTDFE